MSQDTNLQNLIINKLTKAQYDTITPSTTELYLVTDDIGVTADEILPSQTGNSGKYLTTNGTVSSWGTVEVLPSQTSQAGKFLTTDGTVASWGTVEALPTQSGQSGKFLTTDGTVASWGTVSIPSVDQTYSASSTNAQSGTAVAGALTDYLTTNTTQTVSASKTFSGSDVSLRLSNSGKIYCNSGCGMHTLTDFTFRGQSTYFGYPRYVYNKQNAIEIKKFGSTPRTDLIIDDRTILDGTTGLIPDERISTNIARATSFTGADGINAGAAGLVPAPAATDNTKYLKGDGTWASVETGSARNIGEIVQSTIPLTDAGLHLLDGSLLVYGSYKAFIDYIASIYSASSNYFCSEADWQTSVLTYGVCGKFVYDSVNNTVRLPLITGFTEGIITPTTLGNITQAGLPNITGTFTNYYGENIYGDGAFLVTSSAGQHKGGLSTNWATSGMTFDASRSSSIYGNSDTVQPQSVKVLYYIVVATSTKTDIEVDIDEIMTDLSEKVDKSSLTQVYPVIETYVNGNDWYRIWAPDSTGYRWCEQGTLYYKGSTMAGTDNTITFLKTFKDVNYTFIPTPIHSTANVTVYQIYEKYISRTTSTTVLRIPGAIFGYAWVAKGYIADEV